MGIEIAAAAGWPLDVLASAFTAGFEGYRFPVRMDAEGMRKHIEENDIDLSRSRLAVDRGTPVGIALLGIREDTGWVGGLGVSGPHRRRGIGRKLMLALNDAGREAGLRRMTLEVIEGNEGAARLYQGLGFRVTRDLLVLERRPEPVDVSEAECESAAPTEALRCYKAFHQRENPWQRQLASLRRLLPRMSALVLRHEGEVRAYTAAITGKESLHLLDVAFNPGEELMLYRLMRALHAAYPGATAHMVNLPEDDSAWPVMQRMGYSTRLRQFEMELPLS